MSNFNKILKSVDPEDMIHAQYLMSLILGEAHNLGMTKEESEKLLLEIANTMEEDLKYKLMENS